MAKKNFNLNNVRKPEGDEALWALALAITNTESALFPNNDYQEWEPVLSLSTTDYSVRVGHGEYFVQIGTDLVSFKFPEHCPDFPEQLREFCEEYTEIPYGLAPVEEWEIFVDLVKELDEDTLEQLEELLLEVK